MTENAPGPASGGHVVARSRGGEGTAPGTENATGPASGGHVVARSRGGEGTASGTRRRLGLVALGDSITYGEGGIVLGVDGRSWALWLAQALDVPYTNYAVCGVTAGDVVRNQLPRVRADYDLACIYVGVNDVRSPRFDAGAFERDVRAILAGVRERAERVLVCTIPLDLGRPPAGSKVSGANAIVRAAARDHDAVVVSLDDLRGWRLMLPDAVHPTALGQLEIADRAARALGAPLMPSSLVEVDGTRLGLARFARGYAGDVVRDLWRRGTERRA